MENFKVWEAVPTEQISCAQEGRRKTSQARGTRRAKCFAGTLPMRWKWCHGCDVLRLQRLENGWKWDDHQMIFLHVHHCSPDYQKTEDFEAHSDVTSASLYMEKSHGADGSRKSPPAAQRTPLSVAPWSLRLRSVSAVPLQRAVKLAGWPAAPRAMWTRAPLQQPVKAPAVVDVDHSRGWISYF